MAEYLIQEETLNSIANEVREIVGSSEAMPTNEMISGLSEANDEIAVQEQLISEIQAILAEKASYRCIYIGDSVPSNDFGNDGDLFIVRS